MGLYPNHHLVYAVLLNFNPEDKKLCQLLNRLVPKGVKFLHHGKNYYLEISECDNKRLTKTQYYKLYEDMWFNNILCHDHIYRLNEFSSKYYFDQKTSKDVLQEPLTECEYKKLFDDIPLTEIEQTNLSFLLNSELKEYIIDHYWYNRVVVWSSMGGPEDYRKIQYLIEVNIRNDRHDIDLFKKELYTIAKLDLIRDQSTNKIYIKLCDVESTRLHNSKYYLDNIVLWDIVNQHTKNVRVSGGSRFIIDDSDACTLTELEKSNLMSILDSDLKPFIVSHCWYDLLQQYNM